MPGSIITLRTPKIVARETVNLKALSENDSAAIEAAE